MLLGTIDLRSCSIRVKGNWSTRRKPTCLTWWPHDHLTLNLGRNSKRGRQNHSASQTAVSLHYNMYYKNWLPLTRTSKNIFQWYFHIFKVHFSCVWTFDAHLFLWWATEVNMFKIRDGVNKIEVSMISTWNRWNFWEIILNKNCIQRCLFCMVIRFFSSLRLRPMTSGFKGFLSQMLSIILVFLILGLEKQSIFPF